MLASQPSPPSPASPTDLATAWVPPTFPISCGAILLDDQERLLILKPTYKSGWTIPGGIMEDDGETPWEACQREVLEETGLTVESGRLVAVDTRGADDDEPLGVRFLFHCGTLSQDQIAHLTVQPEEVSAARFADLDEAKKLLRKRIRRRVFAALRADACVYLEDGRPVTAVS